MLARKWAGRTGREVEVKEMVDILIHDKYPGLFNVERQNTQMAAQGNEPRFRWEK